MSQDRFWVKALGILISIVLLLPVLSYSQVEATEFFQEAEVALLDRKYKKAIKYFERCLQYKPDMSAAHRGIATCYELLNQYEKAIPHYETVIQSDSTFSRIIYFQLGEAYFKTGALEKALSTFETYKKFLALPASVFLTSSMEEEALETRFSQRLESTIKACKVSMDSLKFVNITEVINLGSAINTRAHEYFPYLSNDQNLLFFNRLKNTDEDLFFSRKNENGWNSGSKVPNFNSSENEGMCTLVRNGRKMYFTVCGRGEVKGPCDIWQAEVIGTEVKGLQSLEGNANSDYWESEASVSCDGRKLFFASNRHDGKGGTDLWYSILGSEGKWGHPVNLGPTINTAGDEESPFITNDGKTLYFSSTGHPGMGEQDLFMSWWDDIDEKWSQPINLGPPVNSPFRELGFFLSADGKTGYFASDRPKGFGKMDIYQFQLSDQLFSEPVTFVEGIVTDSSLNIPVQALVYINGKKPVLTDEQGRFFLCAGADEMLDIEITQKNYLPFHNQFYIPEWNNRSFFTIDLPLKYFHPYWNDFAPDSTQNNPEGNALHEFYKERIHSIAVFFDFDKFKMSASELLKLHDFIQPIKDLKIRRVEIIGFSDDIGADAYNLELSEERAKQIALFLLENDIIVDQIYMEGKGEIKGTKPQEEKRKVEVRITTVE